MSFVLKQALDSCFEPTSVSSFSTQESLLDLADVGSVKFGAKSRISADDDSEAIFTSGQGFFQGLRRDEKTRANRQLKRTKEWSNVYDEWKMVRILGQGTYGMVYKAERVKPGPASESGSSKFCALKRCKLEGSLNYGLPEAALREIALLTELRGQSNIIDLKSVSCNTERVYLVCELLDMDLKQFMKTAGKTPLPMGQIKKICAAILSGVQHLHANGVLHRDLKPHNVLVSTDLERIRVADLGLARHFHLPNKTLTHEVVTLWYRPPELLLGHCRYGPEVDIWSVGCIACEVLSGSGMFQGDSEIDTLFQIFRRLGTPMEGLWPEDSFVKHGEFPKFKGLEDPFAGLHEQLDMLGKDFLRQVLSLDPEARPTASQCLLHPWLHPIERAIVEIPHHEVSCVGFKDQKLRIVNRDVPVTKNSKFSQAAALSSRYASVNLKKVIRELPHNHTSTASSSSIPNCLLPLASNFMSRVSIPSPLTLSTQIENPKLMLLGKRGTSNDPAYNENSGENNNNNNNAKGIVVVGPTKTTSTREMIVDRSMISKLRYRGWIG